MDLKIAAWKSRAHEAERVLIALEGSVEEEAIMEYWARRARLVEVFLTKHTPIIRGRKEE